MIKIRVATFNCENLFGIFFITCILFLPIVALAQEELPPSVAQQQFRFTDEITGESGENIKVHTDGKPTLSVITERIRYVPGQNVIIMGVVFDKDGNITVAKVNLTVEHITAEKTTEKIVYKQSILSGERGFIDDGLNLIDTGNYEITATANIDGYEESSFTQFVVVNYAFTNAAGFMYLGVAGFGGLMILIGSRMTHHITIREVLRFVCISLIAVTPVGVFVLTDVEIGQNAPLGLVVVPKFSEDTKQEDIVAGNAILVGKEWMINFGGNWHTYYVSGIQIPVFVFLFGIAGGYIRYLYKTWGKFFKPGTLLDINNKTNQSQKPDVNALIFIKLPKDSTKDDEKLEKLRHSVRMAVLHRSMMDLALLFLAPLLAIAAFFLLLQAGITENNFPTIAAVSFGIGLGTDAIVKRLESVVTTQFGKDEKKPKPPSD